LLDELPLAAVSTVGTEVFLLITRAVALFIYTYSTRTHS